MAGARRHANAHARSQLLWALLWLGTASGCEHTVVLGTDCPPQDDGECKLKEDRGSVTMGAADDAGTQEPAAQAHDANAPETTRRDAGRDLDDGGKQDQDAALPALDAAAETAIEAGSFPVDGRVPLEIINPSFERNGGLSGDVVLSSVLSKVTFVTTPIIVIFAELPSWYACWPLAVSSVSREPAPDAGTPPVQADYLQFSGFSGTPVRQMLAAPIQPGITYAVEVDVLSRVENGTHLMLEIRGASTECGVGTLLGSSKPIEPEGAWTTTCVEFKTSTAYPYLLISPAYEGPPPSLATRLSLDSIRQVDACPK